MTQFLGLINLIHILTMHRLFHASSEGLRKEKEAIEAQVVVARKCLEIAAIADRQQAELIA